MGKIKKKNLINKIILIILIILIIFFMITFYLSEPLLWSIFLSEDSTYVWLEILVTILNISTFYLILGIIKKYYNIENRENIKIYLYTMLFVSLATNFYVPFIHDNVLIEFLLYIIQYYILIKLYIKSINKMFGYLEITLNTNDTGIYICKMSYNKKAKILDSIGKTKDINLPIKNGDKIVLKDKTLILNVEEKKEKNTNRK